MAAVAKMTAARGVKAKKTRQLVRQVSTSARSKFNPLLDAQNPDSLPKAKAQKTPPNLVLRPNFGSTNVFVKKYLRRILKEFW